MKNDESVRSMRDTIYTVPRREAYSLIRHALDIGALTNILLDKEEVWSHVSTRKYYMRMAREGWEEGHE